MFIFSELFRRDNNVGNVSENVITLLVYIDESRHALHVVNVHARICLATAVDDVIL